MTIELTPAQRKSIIRVLNNINKAKAALPAPVAAMPMDAETLEVLLERVAREIMVQTARNAFEKCEYCGAAYVPSHRGSPQRFCSDSCRANNHWNNRLK